MDFSSMDISGMGYTAPSSMATPSPKKNPAVAVSRQQGVGVVSVNVRNFNAGERVEDDANVVQLFGRTVKRVRVVGKVVNVVTENTNVTYTLADGTGELLVKDWNRAGFEASEGQIISCVGEPRTSGGPATLSSICVAEADELALAHHRIEAVYTQCTLEGPADPNQLTPQKLAAPVATPVKKAPGGDVAESIVAFLRQAAEGGCAVDEIVKALATFPEQDVRSHVARMQKETLLMSTIDDSHVTLTDA